MPDLLDCAFPPPDPAVAARDVRAAGARALGLYVVNLSVPSSVQTPAYVRALLDLGIEILPIVVPGVSPPMNESAFLDPLFIRGIWGTSGAPVMLDVEQPGVDIPPTSWASWWFELMDQAGFVAGEYEGSGSIPYGLARWRCYVDWTISPTITRAIPIGYEAWQYSDSHVGPSGTRYDASWVDPTLKFFGGDMTEQQMQAFLDGLAKQVSGQTSFLGWMQSVLGTEQQTFNVANAIARVVTGGATAGTSPAELGAAFRAAAHQLDGL